MFDKKSREEVLRIWLQAAEEFCRSPAPHVGKFALITGQVVTHADVHDERLWFATHVIEEIAGARTKTSPDKVDLVLLRSRSITAAVGGESVRLIEECLAAGLVASDQKAKEQVAAIREACQRRRHTLSLKGRMFFFD